MRSFDTDLRESLQGYEIQIFHLVSLDIEGDIVYLTDYHRNLTFDGQIWVAAGHLLQFTNIKENRELRIDEVTLSLSGIDQILVSAALQNNIIDKKLKIYLGVHHRDEQYGSTIKADPLYVDPLLIFEGSVSSLAISETDDTVTVSVTATNYFADFNRRNGRHTTDEEQQHYFPGDKGFEFSTRIRKDIKWGKA